MIYGAKPLNSLFFGDIGKNDGSGLYSVYGGHVQDEFNDNLGFDEPGVVALVSDGPNRNDSKFFVTLQKAPQLNGQYTVIGRVVKNLDFLERIAINLGTQEGVVLEKIEISECKVIPYSKYLENKLFKSDI